MASPCKITIPIMPICFLMAFAAKVFCFSQLSWWLVGGLAILSLISTD